MKKKARKKNRRRAPAVVLFTKEKNEKNRVQSCVHAQCQFSGRDVGPVWGHSDAAVRRVLATLTAECDCPADYHFKREEQGYRSPAAKRG